MSKFPYYLEFGLIAIPTFYILIELRLCYIIIGNVIMSSHKIINKNTVKLSYSTTRNMKRILQSHNAKVLNEKETTSEKTCSCPNNRKDTCPLENKCLSSAIVYQATMETSGHFYVGLCETNFKERYAKHKFDFKSEECAKSTTLAAHVWGTGQNPDPAIKWKILKMKPKFQPCKIDK